MTEKDRFVAVAANGKRYTIIEWQHWTEFRPQNGQSQRLPGSTELRTDTYLDVKANSDGTFTLVDTNEILTRI